MGTHAIPGETAAAALEHIDHCPLCRPRFRAELLARLRAEATRETDLTRTGAERKAAPGISSEGDGTVT